MLHLLFRTLIPDSKRSINRNNMKKLVQQAIKLRIYPNKEQQVLLNKNFGCARFVFNFFLNKKKEGYLFTGKSPSRNQCSAELTSLKQTEEHIWLKEVNSQSLQSELEHLEVAYSNFFKKQSSFPRFKSKHSSRHSFHVPQHSSIDIENKTIKMLKFEPIKFRHKLNQALIEPNSITISRNSIDQYFASVQFESEIEIKPSTGECIGVDLGLTHFLIDSNGVKIDNPRLLRKQMSKLKYLQRYHSKKTKATKSRYKARVRLARKHNDIRNQRYDFQQKLSTKLINENQVICLEDLNVKGMTKNHRLAQAITDVAWSQFVAMLKYKGQWHDRDIIKVDRFFPSSKTCSSCDWIYRDEMQLDVRQWTCVKCESVHDRDINAANNVLNQAMCGLGIKSHTKQKPEEAFTLVESFESGSSR